MLRKAFSVATVSLVMSVGSASLAMADGYRGISWTGVSVGAHGGYLWGDTDFPDAPNYVPPPLNGRPSGPPDPDLEGGFAGLQLGYDHQLGSIVIGVVADISFADIDDTVRDGTFIRQTTELERFGTVRAKLGYAHGAWLPYITGGFAWADVTYSQTCPAGAAGGHCLTAGKYSRSDDGNATGWTIGGGLKYAISDHFSVGGEYLHLDLDPQDFTFAPASNGTKIGAADLEIKADIVKVSVDYKF